MNINEGVRVRLWNAAGTAAILANPNNELVSQLKEGIAVSATGASGAAVTLTIPSAGAGKFNYLGYLQILAYAAAAITGVATPVVVTTTGVQGTPSFTFPTAMPIGTIAEQKIEGVVPLKGTLAATALTIVCPATTGIIWRVNASYFTA